MTDEECLANARSQCDNEPSCFGVAWYSKLRKQKLKLCLSPEMEPKLDGWRTMMKSNTAIEGISKVLSKLFIAHYLFSIGS